MAITQSKKQSDLEKRLHLLKQQVYGRTVVKSLKIEPASFTAQKPSSNHTDLTFLKTDLIKISAFAALILGAQFVLFYLIQNKIINF